MGRTEGTAGMTTSNGPAACSQSLNRFPERGHEARHLGWAAAGKDEEHGQAGPQAEPRAKLSASSASIQARPLDERMADIGAGRAAEPLVRLGLERQKREEMIDIGPHFARAARPPGPDAGADVIDDGDLWAALADALGDGVRELGAVDDHDSIRVEGERRIHGSIDAAHELGQPREDCGRPHDSDIGERKDG